MQHIWTADHVRDLPLAEWSAFFTRLFFPLLTFMSIEGVKLALVLAPNLRTGFDGHRRATSHQHLVQRLARCLRLVPCTVFTCSFHLLSLSLAHVSVIFPQEYKSKRGS